MAQAGGRDRESTAKTSEPLEAQMRNQTVTNYKRTRRREPAPKSGEMRAVARLAQCLLFLLCLQLAGSFHSGQWATINCQLPATRIPERFANRANQSHAGPQLPIEPPLAAHSSAFDSVSLLASELGAERTRRQLSSAINRQPGDSSEPAGSFDSRANDEAALEPNGDYESDDELETGAKTQVPSVSGTSLFERQPELAEPKQAGTNTSWNSSRDAALGSTSDSRGSLLDAFFSHIDKQWKFAEIVLIIAISAILNLVTIVGNIMVLISFKMDRSLQTVSNYFLLSLALADLLIGLISMPLYTLYLLLNYWPLGPLMCDIWLAIDYLNSNAAVLNMLIISFDRYFSVTRPLTYRAKRTTKHACLMISCAWLLSLTIWTPAIFTYPYYKGARTVQGTDKCEIEFVKANSYLTFVTAILAFYIPATIMIYLYWRIWLETKKRYRDLTTLFLVSGVGAAAPSRPTRPIISAITSGGLGAAPLKSGPAIGALANRPRGVAQRPAAGQQPASAGAKLKSSLKVSMTEAPPQGGDQKSQPNDGDVAATGKPSRNEAQKREQRQMATNLGQVSTRDDEAPITDNKGASDNHQDAKLASINGMAPSRTEACSCKCVAAHHSGSTTFHGARCHSVVCKAARKTTPLAAACKHCRDQLRGHREPTARMPATGAVGRSSGACYSCCCPHSSSASRCCSASRRHEPHQPQDKNTPSGARSASDSMARAGARSANCTACANSSSIKTTNTLPPCCLIAARNRGQPEKSLSHSNVASAKPAATQQEALDTIPANQSSSNKSIHQLMSEAGRQRAKIHPRVSSSEQQVAAKAAAEDESKERRLVDVATSPIHFSTLNLMELGRVSQPSERKSADELQARRSPPPASNSPQESCEQEDFETRIVSQGDRFRFESNDPKLVASLRASKVAPANCGQQTAARAPHHEHHSWTKHQSAGCCCADMIQVHDAECKFCRPIVKPDQHFGQQSSRQRGRFHPDAAGAHQCHHSHSNNHHHHHHHHRHHHHTHHHHRHNTLSQPNKANAKQDCKKCPFQGLGQATMKQECAPNSETNKLQEAALEDADATPLSLPILGALEQTGVESKEPGDSLQKITIDSRNLQLPLGAAAARAKRTKYKKFSQKLTFSDILVDERSPSTSDRLTLHGSNSDSVRNNSRRLRQLYDSGSSQEHDDGTQTQPNSSRGSSESQSWFARGASNLTSSLASVPLIGALVRQSRRRNRPVRYAHEQIRYRDEESRRQQQQQQQDQPDGDERRKSFLRRLCCSRSRPIMKRLSGNEASLNKSHRPERSSSSIDSNSNGLQGRRQHPAKNGSKNASSKSSSSSSGGSSQPTQQHNNSNYHHHHPIQPKSERKAAKTLSTLLLVFIVTWLPYNVLVLIKTLSGGEDQVPEKIWNFSYYLCYINSTINPLCYALCNAQFRRTYMRILKCKLSNDHASSTRRMVPIQSSNTWNKDLRLNSSYATLDTTTAGSSRKSAPSEIASFPSG